MIGVPPVIDGILDEPCWVEQTSIVLELGNWSTSTGLVKPEYDFLNGTISISNNDNYLFLGIEIRNISGSAQVIMAIDDKTINSHPDLGFHRGVVYWRSEQGTYISANQMWSVFWNEIQFWTVSSYGPVAHTVYPISTQIQWNWTRSISSSISMEGAFQFRNSHSDPDWLLERVYNYSLHFVLEVINTDSHGYYSFPVGSPVGAQTENDIENWYHFVCRFTPLLGVLWPSVLVAVLVFLVVIIGLVAYLYRRNRHSQKKE